MAKTGKYSTGTRGKQPKMYPSNGGNTNSSTRADLHTGNKGGLVRHATATGKNSIARERTVNHLK